MGGAPQSGCRARGLTAELVDAIWPDWAAPPNIRALMSTRQGGVSAAPFDSLNLRPSRLPALPQSHGPGTGAAWDAADAVLENQRRFAAALGATPVWLNQVHGADVVHLRPQHLLLGAELPRADASISTEPGIACAVLVADCLPVLLCSANGRAVGAAHAGWRGLAAGVIDNTVAALCLAADCRADQLLGWLGPCIGPRAFEVGAEVLPAFGQDLLAPDVSLFLPSPRPDGSMRWRADLVQLARRRLASAGVLQVSGGGWCTATETSRFFSFRRDGRTGRLGAAVALRG